MIATKSFDPQRLLKQPNLFQRFDVTDSGVPLKKAGLPSSANLLVFERRGERRALWVQEMAYHHAAQGELAGEPYLITFCGVCNSGVGMTPMVNGKVHHFSAGGLYNGVVILTDDETNSYWDHITGQAVHGALEGSQLKTWGIEMTTVKAALKNEPDLLVLRSHQRPIVSRFMRILHWIFGKTGFLPPFFVKTMAQVDPRLSSMTLGLGVVVDEEARFYPQKAIDESIVDDWHGQPLKIGIDEIAGVPYATWEDGTRPLQLFLRWYGFVLTFPNCSLYKD